MLKITMFKLIIPLRASSLYRYFYLKVAADYTVIERVDIYLSGIRFWFSLAILAYWGPERGRHLILTFCIYIGFS